MSYNKAGKAENEKCMFENRFLMMCPKGQADSGTRLSRVFYQLASVMSAIIVRLAFRSETVLSTHLYDFNNVKEVI